MVLAENGQLLSVSYPRIEPSSQTSPSTWSGTPRTFSILPSDRTIFTGQLLWRALLQEHFQYPTLGSNHLHLGWTGPAASSATFFQYPTLGSNHLHNESRIRTIYQLATFSILPSDRTIFTQDRCQGRGVKLCLSVSYPRIEPSSRAPPALPPAWLPALSVSYPRIEPSSLQTARPGWPCGLGAFSILPSDRTIFTACLPAWLPAACFQYPTLGSNHLHRRPHRGDVCHYQLSVSYPRIEPSSHPLSVSTDRGFQTLSVSYPRIEPSSQ